MVRASRNVSNQRRAGRVLGAESMPPGWESTPAGRDAAETQDYGEHARAAKAEAERAAGPPGAKLDRYPFAASWAAFLTAIRDDDKGGSGPAKRAIRNAMSESTGSEGGFLVPWSLTEQVFAYLAEAVIWPRAMVLTMGTYRVGLPLLDNPSQANGAQGLGGVTFSVVPDGQPIPASNPRFGETVLDARKLAALISPVPDELADDAAAAFSDLFGRIVGMGLAWELDHLFFNGTGTGEPEGILNAPAGLKVTRANSGQAPVHADVVAMLKAAHPASKKRLAWLMSEDVFDALLELYEVIGTAPSGQMIPPPNTLRFNTETGTWELLGVPAEISDHQPAAGTTGDLVLADLSLYAIGNRELMTIDRSSKGSTFTAAASAYRVRTRVDGRYLPRSTYVLANGKTVSPLVILN